MAAVFDVTDVARHDGDLGVTQFVHWSKRQAFFVTMGSGSVGGLGYSLVTDIVNGGHQADKTSEVILHVASETLVWAVIACLFLLPIVVLRNLSLYGLSGQSLAKTGSKWKIKEALVFSPVASLLFASCVVASDSVTGLNSNFGKLVYALTVCVLSLLVIGIAVALMVWLRNMLYR
ncbi:MAG: hypothetical protein AAGL24_04725 [Pseudomonadota bacterium]